MRFESPWLLLLALLPAAMLAAASWRSGWRPRRPVSRRAWAPGRGLPAGALAAALLAVAAAGPELALGRRPAPRVVAVDLSASVDGAARRRALERLASPGALDGDGESVAMVAFGAGAVVERGFEAAPVPLEPGSEPGREATALAGALRLATGLLAGGAEAPRRALGGQVPDRRVVLLSDGLATDGDDPRLAAAAAFAAGVAIDVVPLPAARPGGPVVVELRAPARVRLDEPFGVTAAIEGTAGATGRLRFAIDGMPFSESDFRLAGGRQEVAATATLGGAGSHLITAERVGGGEGGYGARAGAVVEASRRPRVLYLRPEGRSAPLAEGLRRSGFDVELASDGAAVSGPRLERLDAVILDDLPAAALAPERAAELAAWVADRGGGLLVVGRRSFGPAGWVSTPLEAALPVQMRPGSGRRGPAAAVVLVLDKSGSMAAEASAGSKLDAARRAALALLEGLAPGDTLGVVAFDRAARVVLPPTGLPAAAEVAARLAALDAGGGTELAPALELAYDWLAASTAPRGLLLLVSDGRADAAAIEVVERRAAAAASVELSAIGLGRDADRELLAGLAAAGGGRLTMAPSSAELAELFEREGRRLGGRWWSDRRERLAIGDAHPVLAALPAAPGEGPSLPILAGHAVTRLRPAATAPIETGEGTPVVACWRYGLGRGVVLTADLGAGGGLARWPGFADLWPTLVRWTARRLGPGRLEARAAARDDRVEVTVDAHGGAGGYGDGLELAAFAARPDGTRAEAALEQIAPGRYRGSLPLAGRGTYRMVVEERATGEAVRFGLHLEASTERRAATADRVLLEEIARRGGGRVLEPEAVAGGVSSRGWRPVWRWPGLAGLVLFAIAAGRRGRGQL